LGVVEHDALFLPGRVLPRKLHSRHGAKPHQRWGFGFFWVVHYGLLNGSSQLVVGAASSLSSFNSYLMRSIEMPSSLAST
jgi:hypothetical protein